MAKDQSAKPKEKKQRGKAFKETFSELKKVTWPSFGEVVKQTGIVLAVVLVSSSFSSASTSVSESSMSCS